VNDIDAWVWWLVGAAALGIPLVVTAMPEFGMLAYPEYVIHGYEPGPTSTGRG